MPAPLTQDEWCALLDEQRAEWRRRGQFRLMLIVWFLLFFFAGIGMIMAAIMKSESNVSLWLGLGGTILVFSSGVGFGVLAATRD
jgi:hypothetical protein